MTPVAHYARVMSNVPVAGPVPGRAAGLCDTCRYQREVRNTRGSTFSLCERSRQDPAYPRYPRLPVSNCRGYEVRES